VDHPLSATPRRSPDDRTAETIVAIGTDVAVISAVSEAITDFGAAYLDRLFTSAEQGECRVGIDGAQRTDAVVHRAYAELFAAKEAILKVLGPSGPRPPWRTIEVHRDHQAGFEVVLAEAAAELADHIGAHRISVTVAHEGPLVLAVATATSGAS
jgi:phosphopantetheine--protein transferase-like protein